MGAIELLLWAEHKLVKRLPLRLLLMLSPSAGELLEASVVVCRLLIEEVAQVYALFSYICIPKTKEGLWFCDQSIFAVLTHSLDHIIE